MREKKNGKMKKKKRKVLILSIELFLQKEEETNGFIIGQRWKMKKVQCRIKNLTITTMIIVINNNDSNEQLASLK